MYVVRIDRSDEPIKPKVFEKLPDARELFRQVNIRVPLEFEAVFLFHVPGETDVYRAVERIASGDAVLMERDSFGRLMKSLGPSIDEALKKLSSKTAE